MRLGVLKEEPSSRADEAPVMIAPYSEFSSWAALERGEPRRGPTALNGWAATRVAARASHLPRRMRFRPVLYQRPCGRVRGAVNRPDGGSRGRPRSRPLRLVAWDDLQPAVSFALVALCGLERSARISTIALTLMPVSRASVVGPILRSTGSTHRRNRSRLGSSNHRYLRGPCEAAGSASPSPSASLPMYSM